MDAYAANDESLPMAAPYQSGALGVPGDVPHVFSQPFKMDLGGAYDRHPSAPQPALGTSVEVPCTPAKLDGLPSVDWGVGSSLGTSLGSSWQYPVGSHGFGHGASLGMGRGGQGHFPSGTSPYTPTHAGQPNLSPFGAALPSGNLGGAGHPPTLRRSSGHGISTLSQSGAHGHAAYSQGGAHGHAPFSQAGGQSHGAFAHGAHNQHALSTPRAAPPRASAFGGGADELTEAELFSLLSGSLPNESLPASVAGSFQAGLHPAATQHHGLGRHQGAGAPPAASPVLAAAAARAAALRGQGHVLPGPGLHSGSSSLASSLAHASFESRFRGAESVVAAFRGSEVAPGSPLSGAGSWASPSPRVQAPSGGAHALASRRSSWPHAPSPPQPQARAAAAAAAAQGAPPAHAHPTSVLAARSSSPSPAPAASPRSRASPPPTRPDGTSPSELWPLAPATVVEQYGHLLDAHERSEIATYPEVWFLGRPDVVRASSWVTPPASPRVGGGSRTAAAVGGDGVGDAATSAAARPSPRRPARRGWDTERGEYVVQAGDHLAYRYEVEGEIGRGSFGTVLRCRDWGGGGRRVAVKVMRSSRRLARQATIEGSILSHLAPYVARDRYSIVRSHGAFMFRGHLCVGFELLELNLYEHLQERGMSGCGNEATRKVAEQILNALGLLAKLDIVHCDLKPENIMLVDRARLEVKLIDFGSACYREQQVYTYVQSRFYRAPEVILGQRYGPAIDAWSLACVLAELRTGYPLFPGEDERQQLAYIVEVLGCPPRSMLETSSRADLFFDRATCAPLPTLTTRSGKRAVPGCKPLASFFGSLRAPQSFLDFLAAALRWDPAERPSAADLRRHEWIVDVWN